MVQNRMWDDKGSLIKKGVEAVSADDNAYTPLVRVQSGFFNLEIEVNGESTIAMIVS